MYIVIIRTGNLHDLRTLTEKYKVRRQIFNIIINSELNLLNNHFLANSHKRKINNSF